MSLWINIKKQYKNFSLAVNFENSGEPIGLLGASGSGKSLILRCIAGIVKPDQGIIVLNDRVLFDSDKGINVPPRKRNVGLLFQSYALFPNMTVRENIGIGIRNRSDKYIITNKMLKIFRLEPYQDRYPGQLSGGEQQRAALARILAYEPEILLLDEPFSALDSFLKEGIYEELQEVLSGYDKDIMMVSHSRKELYRFCDTIAVLEHGKLLEFGEKKKIFECPEHRETARLTECRNISRVEKRKDYEVNAVDWGIILHTDQKISDEIHYIGIREQQLVAVQEMGDNTMPVALTAYSEGPEEIHLVFKNRSFVNESTCINWSITKKEWKERQEKVPEYLCLPKDKIILLKS